MPRRDDLSHADRGTPSAHAGPRAGWVCPHVPLEILLAAGMTPVRLGGAAPDTGHADRYFPTNVCPLLRGVLEDVLHGGHSPDMFVIAETCEGVQRLADILRRTQPRKPLIRVDVPYVVDERAVAYLADGLRSLTDRLAAESGVCVTDEDVAASIEKGNAARARLRSWLVARRAGTSGIRDGDWLRLLETARQEPERTPEVPAERSAEAAEVPAVLLIGNFMEEPSLLTHLADSGARLADEDLCTGMRWAREDVKASPDVFIGLARHDLVSMACPRSVGPAYLERLRSLALGVSGVIALKPKFCDASQLVFVRERRLFRSIGLPVLLLETDGNAVMNGQTRTRVSAFLEMLT